MSSLPIFHVRNLGPIQEATVRLHPLTILIGKNNTGKTYMAKAIYAAYKALERANAPIKPSMTIEESDEFLNRLQTKSEHDRDVLQGSLRNKAEDWMGSRMDRAGRSLEGRLIAYFDLDDLEELRRWEGKGTLDVSVRTDSSDFLFGLRTDDSGSGISLPAVTVRDFQKSSISDAWIALVGEMLEDGGDQQDNPRNRRASARLAGSLWEDHLLPSVGLDGAAYYLPAGRSGLIEAWTDVVRLRLQQDRDGLALAGRASAALGGIALDFLSELQNLTSFRSGRPWRFRPGYRRGGRSKSVQSAARHLEELIEGEVGLARGRDRVPSLTYTQRGKSITVQRSSSMVAELAPLLSWIRHVLYPGDLILIDEPEAHMHPEAVLAVAQTLVALSSAGVKVLCTTHSSEFLHQVSNSMLRSALGTSKSPNETTSIDVADIGVYRFERSPKSSGTQAVRVKIDPRWGIPEDEHVAVAEKLSQETAELVESHG